MVSGETLRPATLIWSPKPAAQKNLAVFQFRQVAGLKNSGAERIRFFRPIRFRHRAAAHGQTAIVVERQIDVLHRRAGERGIGARRIAGVVGDAAAFGGAEKIMDFEAVTI